MTTTRHVGESSKQKPVKAPESQDLEGRILVVEDDETLRDLIALQLRSQGYAVAEAATGLEGRRLAREWAPDLILLDVNLPDSRGWEICAELKADPATRPIPVIILTALDSSRDRWQGLESGADDYLSKPFQPQELLIRVKSLLRLCQLYRRQVESEQLRIRYETQQEFERLKDSFISILSHELHTPLTVLKGYLGLLRELRGMPGSARVLDDSLDDMTASLVQLESLIRELLDYSRLRAGVLTLRRRPVEMCSLLRTCCHRLEVQAHEKGIRLEYDFPRRPVRLRADPDRLSQAIRHLVENAVKFTPQDGVVRVSCRDRGDGVHVRVKDSGEGIPPKELARIFEPFYQASDYMTRKEGGVGLGLTTARHIVADHGGDIRARSRPGEGSVFLVRLPRSYRDAREVLARLRRRMHEIESGEAAFFPSRTTRDPGLS